MIEFYLTFPLHVKCEREGGISFANFFVILKKSYCLLDFGLMV
jgi:hypothetical protein